MPFTVSVTYEVWNEESLEIGETDEKGFESEDEAMSLREVVRKMEGMGSWEHSSSPFELRPGQTSMSLYVIDDDVNFRTGERTTHAVHVKGSARAIRRLVSCL